MEKKNCLLVFLALFLFPLSSNAGLADAPWPSLYRDSFNSGYSVYQGPRASGLEVKSKVDIKGQMASPVIGRDGTLYVGSSDGAFYEVKEGKKKIIFSAQAGINSSAAISDKGNIYFGSKDGMFHSIELNGYNKWSISLGSGINSAPAIGPFGKVFIVSENDLRQSILNCVSDDGRLLWQREIDPVSVNSSPAVDGSGNVYTGGVTGIITCFTNTGNFLWSYDIEEMIVSSLVIGNEGYTLYCASFKSLSAVRFSSKDMTAQLLWKYEPVATYLGHELASGFLSSPAVDSSGRIFIGGIFGDMHAIEDTGDSYRLLWSKSLNPDLSIKPRIVSSPPIIGKLGNIYIRTGKYLHILDNQGKVLKSNFSVLTTEVEGQADSPIVLGANRTLYFVGCDGLLYAVGSTSADFSIRGTVSGDCSGVKIFLEGAVKASVDVDTDGTYRLNSLIPGNYIVVPFRQGLIFEPATRKITISNDDVVNIDFNATRVAPWILSAYSDIVEVPNDGATPVTFFAEVEGAVDRVFLNLEEIGGCNEQDMTEKENGIYEFTTTVPPGVSIGIKPISVKARGAGGTAVNNLTINVLNFVSGYVLDRFYYIEIESEGQMLLFTYSQDCEGGICEPLFFQVFKPSSTGIPDYEEAITEEEKVLSIENAQVGTWSYKVTQHSNSAKVLSNSLSQFSSKVSYTVNTATAGTGVLFGLVSDAQTGEPLDRVSITTTTGASTITDGGYYIMLSAAGVFSMSTQSLSHKQETKSISLMSGNQLEANLFLLPSNFDDGTGGCFLTELFGGGSQQAYFLRLFRDSVLKRTDYGKDVITKYYFHSPEVSAIIKKDNDLRINLIILFLKLLPVLNAIVQEDVNPRLSYDQKEAVIKCLNQIKEKAGKELGQEIDCVIDDIGNDNFFKK